MASRDIKYVRLFCDRFMWVDEHAVTLLRYLVKRLSVATVFCS